MNIYWIVLIITAILAIVFEKSRKWFVIFATGVHTFVCGFRYMYMHGDLQKYAYEFSLIKEYQWNSEDLIKNGRNTLFYILNKLVAQFFNSDFQVLLFIIALVSSISIGIVIFKYSLKPFISYLIWSCFGFYMFSFYSIKQTLAMAIIMIASIGIFEDNRKWFYMCTIIAGFVHFPAFIFLPAYELCKVKNVKTIINCYGIAVVVIFLFRNYIVSMMSELYYEDGSYTIASYGGVGGKFIMMVAIMICAYLLCGLSDNNFRISFLLVSVASLLQMFSIYDHVFTRLADYYFQFFILLAAFMCAPCYKRNAPPLLLFNRKSQEVITVIFSILAILFYYTTYLSGDPTAKDSLLNFSWMWSAH